MERSLVNSVSGNDLMNNLIDFHVHVSTDPSSTQLYPGYSVQRLLIDQRKNHISKSICFINPFVSGLLCPASAKHKIKILDSPIPGYIRLYCTTCKKEFFHGVDPIRRYNIEFLRQVSGIPSLLPLVYLNICPSNINEEISFYENAFPDTIYGYKLHPTLSGRTISELNIYATSKLIVVHTGVELCADPRHALQFATQYPGIVILAHLARFHQGVLSALSRQDNLFVDTSPMTFLYSLVCNKPHRVFSTKWISADKDCQLTFYCNLFEKIDCEKVLFATDAPFSDCMEENRFLKKIPRDFLMSFYRASQKVICSC